MKSTIMIIALAKLFNELKTPSNNTDHGYTFKVRYFLCALQVPWKSAYNKSISEWARAIQTLHEMVQFQQDIFTGPKIVSGASLFHGDITHTHINTSAQVTCIHSAGKANGKQLGSYILSHKIPARIYRNSWKTKFILNELPYLRYFIFLFFFVRSFVRRVVGVRWKTSR